MIQDIREKIKEYAEYARRDWFVILVIFLVSFASFGLGRLSAVYGNGSRDHLEIVYPEAQEAAALGAAALKNRETGAYVASVSGSKYHRLDCPGASAIKEENKLYFSTKEAAEAAGYAPAANCKGL